MKPSEAETLPPDLSGRFEELLRRLGNAAVAAGRKPPRRGHSDSYMCCCPAHDDRDPSLSVRLQRGDKILTHCFAGCEPEEVAAAVGLPMAALFEDYHGEATEYPRLKWNGSSTAGEQAIAGKPNGSTEPEFAGAGQFARGPLPLPPATREFLELEFPATAPLLGPIATQQLVIVYAPPGVGKSMFALAVSHAIASGTEFLGWQPSRPAKVLYIDGEMAGEMLQRRLAKAGHDNLYIANCQNWAASSGYDPINLCEEQGAETVHVWANALGAEVLVLDNLMSLAWMPGISMNSDEYWQPIRRFAVWQRSVGRTVIIIDHANKSGSLHGTGTKTWQADLVLALTQVGEDPEPTLKDGKMVIPPARFSISAKKVRDSRWDTSGGVPHDFSKVVEIGAVGQQWGHTSSKEEMMQQARVMRKNGLSVRDIAEEIGASKSTVARWTKGWGE